MRNLERNEKTVYYREYLGKTMLSDSSGRRTLQYAIEYGEPVMIRANVSRARGSADIEQVGILDSYDATLVTHNLSLPFTESTIFYIDKEPPENDDNGTQHNYVVRRVSKSLNAMSVYLKKVDVK